MAQILFRALAGTYEVGDPITAIDDSARFGTYEDKREWVLAGNPSNTFPGGFFVVSIPGYPILPIKNIIELQDRTPENTLSRKRLWKLYINELTAQQQTDINNHFVELTIAEFRPYFRNKTTNETWQL